MAIDFKKFSDPEWIKKQREKREEELRIFEESEKIRHKTVCFTGHRPQKLGGNRTCESFTKYSFPLYFHSYEERANKMLQVSNKEIQFLKRLPLYCEFGDTLFVHAGINPHLRDWRKSVEKDFLWTRGHWNHPNETGKTIIFGHTPVKHIHDSDEVWVSKCKSYIGIDGGAVFKGQLNGIVIDKKGQILEKYKV